MAKSLVIVESPAKARAVQLYLGKEYDVRASMGHVLDLTKKDGIRIEKKGGKLSFTPVFQPIKKKEDVIKELQKLAKKADAVYVAPDPDREGEAIAHHIAGILSHPDVRRVLFHEITKSAVMEAFRHPRAIDMNLVESQQARRILDRIVGFDISQLLWEKVARGLSAGRVQTVALRLIVEREREIKKFVPVESWSITAELQKDKESFEAKLVRIKDENAVISTKHEADRILKALDDSRLTVTKVKAAERRRNPAPPFITSTLQQEASRRLGFPVAITMRVAQGLYEGVELPEGLTGLITYMRTDSVRVSEASISEAREYIAKNLGTKFLPRTPNVYKTSKSAQDAHEAIRPTSVERTPKVMAKYLDRRALGVYKLIWSRFVASQCESAVFDGVSVDLVSGDFLFRATGSTVKFKGFLKVFDDVRGEDSQEDKAQKLPKLVEGDLPRLKKYMPEQHFTQPPPRFSEATLVKALEEQGIGRPSTYAMIIQTLRDRKYTHVEKRRLAPSDLGMSVCDLLVNAFPDVFNVSFTAGMENGLDEVEEGSADWQEVLRSFYREFVKDMGEAEKSMPNLKAGVETEHRCPTCDSHMLLRYGRMGRFFACPNYPTCTTTFEVAEDRDGKIIKVEKPEFPNPCPKCAGKMLFKRSRFGAFLACAKYPDCRGVLALVKTGENEYEVERLEPVLAKCPLCGGDMEMKKSRYGRFLACTKYPACTGSRPYLLNVPCPSKGCGGELCERQSKRGIYYPCVKFPDCKFRSYSIPVAKACPKCGAPAMFRVKGELRCGLPECEGVLEDPEAHIEEPAHA